MITEVGSKQKHVEKIHWLVSIELPDWYQLILLQVTAIGPKTPDWSAANLNIMCPVAWWELTSS